MNILFVKRFNIISRLLYLLQILFVLSSIHERYIVVVSSASFVSLDSPFFVGTKATRKRHVQNNNNNNNHHHHPIGERTQALVGYQKRTLQQQHQDHRQRHHHDSALFIQLHAMSPSSSSFWDISNVDDITTSLQMIPSTLQDTLKYMTDAAKTTSLVDNASLVSSGLVETMLSIMSSIAQSSIITDYPILSFIISTIVTYTVTSSILQMVLPPIPTTPYPDNGKYDPIASRLYFDRRLPIVLSRGLQVLVQSLQFGIKVYQDQVSKTNTIEKEEQRGIELATLLTKLGPTFIKVGQSLSIRTDLLSPAYIRGLATLQDQVPPFNTEEAKLILEKEWGRPVTDIIQGTFPSEPIAAASLGQVYKVTLQDSNIEVAVKVQRPNIMEQIALDMYLLREVGGFVRRVFNLNTDTVGTVDAWGIGFVNELNYIQEAMNGQNFNEQIQQTPLKDVVFSPKIVNQYSTNRVLVTEWVNGERLDRSSSDDVSVLCSIAMNTYLTMLLEIGVLHCDPHPGNLLRTPDGKLCILDWGMVTQIDPGLQLTLIEHMAHLTSADYAEIPRDLLLLGFIPESKADLIEDSGVVDVLADIYGAWTSGGGAAAIDVNKVVSQLQDLTATKGNLFRIPPYFAYIAKSFSVLEGIGLSNQPGTYSIINECLPYVSKRLLSDKDTMGPALSTFIFGPEKSNSDRIVNYKRVKQLVEGFGQYTTSSSGALLGKETSSRTQLMEEATEQILNLVFTEEETPLQQILLEQIAKIVSSSSRYILTELRERSGVLPSGRTVLGVALDPLGLFRTSPLVRTNELDEQTVETTRKLIELVRDQVQKTKNPLFDLTTLTREETIQLSQMLIRKVWNRRVGVFQTGNRFARTLLQLTADKLEKGERDTRRIPSFSDRSSNGSTVTSSSSGSSRRGMIEQSDRATAGTSSRTAASSLVLQQQQQQNQPPLGGDSTGRTASPDLSPVLFLESKEKLSLSEVAVTSATSRLDGARKLLESLKNE